MHGNHLIGDFLGSWICLVISWGGAGFLDTALGSGHLLLSQGNPMPGQESGGHWILSLSWSGGFLKPLLLFWCLVDRTYWFHLLMETRKRYEMGYTGKKKSFSGRNVEVFTLCKRNKKYQIFMQNLWFLNDALKILCYSNTSLHLNLYRTIDMFFKTLKNESLLISLW